MNKRKALEITKTILIVLLLLSALFLLRENGYISFNSRRKNVDDGSEGISHSIESSNYINFYSPTSLCVCLGAKGSYGLIYNDSEISDIAGKYSALVGEALGTAENVQDVDISKLREYLDGVGVYFGFAAELPLDCIADALGTNSSEELSGISTEFLYLFCGLDSNASLIFGNENNAKIARTSLPNSLIIAINNLFLPNSVAFSFSYSEYEGMSPFILIEEDLSEIYSYSYKSAYSSGFNRVGFLDSFGMNSVTASDYTDREGAFAFIDNGKDLRITTNSISFKDVAEDSESDLSVYQQIRYAAYIVDKSVIPYIGDASVRLTSVSGDIRNLTVSFSYFINGMSVSGTGNNSITAHFDNGRLSSFNAYVLNFANTNEIVKLLPMSKSAAIAVGNKKTNLNLVLVPENGRLTCGWVTKDE